MSDSNAATGVLDVSYAVGVVNYHSYRDLQRCLESVKGQTKPPELIVVVDADSDPRQLEFARSSFPGVTWLPRPNLGFAAGANLVVRRVLADDSRIGFVLILNPDVEVDPEYAESLAGAMAERPDVALGSGKLLRPDGVTLDSAGIVMGRNRRPRDRGSDEADQGLYDEVERLFAVSGAAMMIRAEAVADLSVAGELFDEDFFAYHEDTDLAWRARLLGWSALYFPGAEARHVRGWQRTGRMRVPRRIRQHSFKNHYLQIIKNERLLDFLLNLPILLAWEVLRLGYAVVRDPGVLPAYWSAARLVPRTWAKRRRIQERVRVLGRHAAPSYGDP